MLLSKEFLSTAFTGAAYYVGHGEWTANPEQGLVAIADVSNQSDAEVTLSIDSRTLEPGQIFLALKGPQFDGHDFLVQALEKGTSVLIVSNKETLAQVPAKLLINKLVILVADTQKALVNVAKAWRQTLKIPLVAITGSVGKTSTKEMTRTLLQAAGMRVYASYKNQNNIIGLSLNILKVRRDHEVAVFEVGINERGEMAELVDVLRPTIALITCIAHAHGQGLGSLQEISFEKRQIFKHLTMSDVGVIFGDQDLLIEASYHHPIAKFGFKTRNQVQARKISVVHDGQFAPATHFVLKWYGKKASVAIKSNHRGSVTNALAASTIAYLLKIPFDAVVAGLQNYAGTEERFEMKTIAGNRGRVISDCYNANPESMKAALVAFEQLTAKGGKIAVLGDMLELGHKEMYWHRQIGRLLRKMQSIEKVILVGERARYIAETAPLSLQVSLVKDWQEAQKLLDKLLTTTDDALVLVKASHGMHLSNMVDALVN